MQFVESPAGNRSGLAMYSCVAALSCALLVAAGCGRRNRHVEGNAVRPVLAVEMTFGDRKGRSHSMLDCVAEDGGFSLGLSGDTLVPLPATAANKSQSLNLRVEFRSDGARVTAVSNAWSTDGSNRWRPLASHSARLGETFELSEVKASGYQPRTFRVVDPLQGWSVPISKVPSIQFAQADGKEGGCVADEHKIVRFERPLVVDNLSSRAIVAFAWAEGTDSPNLNGTFDFPGTFVIPPNGSMQLVSRQPGPVAVTAALFDDGSHQGDEATAALLESRRIGAIIQRGRIMPVVGSTLEKPAMDDDARLSALSAIQDSISRLSTQPDATMLAAIQSQFPNMSQAALAEDLRRGLSIAREQLWRMFSYEFARPMSRTPPTG